MTTLHIVGCGRVGRSLARLWAEAGTFSIGQVLNRSVESAREAASFIGQGSAVERLERIDAGDWLMLAAPDGRLASIATDIAETLGGKDREPGAGPALAFHVSGAEPAEVLRPIGRPVASVHPVCPFSDPSRAVETFAGSHALGEGDDEVLDSVLAAFAQIGAATMRFDPVDKRRYHAATIAASNFLNVLDDLALGLAESAGLAHEQALKVIVALQRAGLANIERVGPVQALTGPIERGDRAVCEKLARTPGVAGNDLFMALARAAVDLAERKHGGRSGYLPDPLRELFAESGIVRSGGADGGL